MHILKPISIWRAALVSRLRWSWIIRIAIRRQQKIYDFHFIVYIITQYGAQWRLTCTKAIGRVFKATFFSKIKLAPKKQRKRERKKEGDVDWKYIKVERREGWLLWWWPGERGGKRAVEANGNLPRSGEIADIKHEGLGKRDFGFGVILRKVLQTVN